MALSRVMTSWLGTSPDAVDEGDDEGESRLQRLGVTAEALDREVPPLRHDFDAGRQRGDEEDEQDEDESTKAEHGTLLSERRASFDSYRAR
jgi:hypothetical protein